ncbi:MAG: MgtC/SapB family protein [Flavobacteriaceae bacterium]|jgi:putative Mg2+ transporter-C (MgtC) family protein|uniref:MgtC/SapB family transporter n=1 Tax=Flavobacterium frigoris (strain PS1) TaxID=1086011 RepID=H7FVV0_FLAFP|nr:MgtC/SapB family protein [Flavobacterium frigoris]EIA07361.1 mgtC/SapB family transporter [Flavobacterium frigoris PS1]MBX9889096.1 MgtC/SapB family protein [Flavobacteriaceae bacterium]|tara:strand:+ start:1522 stop:1989 length:468 start_codon:yes stop_codon:yes gene_type:complete
MDINAELIIVSKLIISFFLGAFIGFDRERHGQDAGIRTYAAVCIGATLFTAITAHLVSNPADTSRVIANIVTGVGFLGAGIIYRNNSVGTSHGLTTAATIWCTSAVGVAVGLNMFIISIVASLALYFLLSLHHQKWYLKWKQKMVHEYVKENDDN